MQQLVKRYFRCVFHVAVGDRLVLCHVNGGTNIFLFFLSLTGCSLFLFLINYYVPFEKRECFLLVGNFLFFCRDYSSIVEPLFLL